jgi:uncharacterized repeat protein (TIGR01451 family)
MISVGCGGRARARARRRVCALAACGAGAIALAPVPAFAGGTPAGTNIQNVATATYDVPGGGTADVASNTVTIRVDELIDVAVAWADPADVAVTPGAASQLLRFTVTNGGNGPERFALSTVAAQGGDDFDPVVTAIFLDANGNNAYDAGVDTLYVAGSNDPLLGADESIAVFVLSSIPPGGQDQARGRVDLVATARTGTGAPGTAFAGQGEGGGNAVIGATGGRAQDDGWYRLSAASLAFVKSASVADPYGGVTQVPGSVITYTLVATVSGSGALPNLRVSDPIPAGTTYQPGSIRLEGTSLTDAADGDSGRFTGSAIEVGLGSVPAGASRTVSFRVTID